MNTDLAYLQKEFLDQIQFIRKELTDIKKNRDSDEMWDNSDLTRNWKVSLRTLAEWRAEGKIGYVQIGNKIWYPREERELFIKANLVKVRLKNGGEAQSN
ncbi:MAG: helix-turn-helix domain-containing protein [Prolixibacteraceae bacterium]|nr:helix-turn-helix domain-containing protein [Prolixibacteraceae bacterium]